MAFLQQYGSQSPTNWAGWRSVPYDRLLEQSSSASDTAARMQLLLEAETVLSSEVPLIPIYHYQGKVLVAPRVRGWWDGAIGTPPSRFLSVE
jgi:oligopeptide transport system substrate-binding protein